MRAIATSILVASLCSAPAYADEDGAIAAYKRAEHLHSEGKILESCKYRDTADQESPNLKRKFSAAKCYEEASALATAWKRYDMLLQLLHSQLQSTPADRDLGKMQSLVEDRKKAIEPRVPKLVVSATEPVAGLVVTRQFGQDAPTTISTALLGADIWVDPGDYTVVASAPGFETFTVNVIAKESLVTRVEIPVLSCSAGGHKTPEGCKACRDHEDWNGKACACAAGFESVAGQCTAVCAAGEVRKGTTCQSTAGNEPPKREPETEPPPAAIQKAPESHSGVPTTTWVLGGLGVASLATGGILLGVAGGKWSDSKNDGCTASSCTLATGHQMQVDAQTMANVATVFLVGGVALAGVGIAVWALDGNKESPKTALVVGPGFLSLEGKF